MLVVMQQFCVLMTSSFVHQNDGHCHHSRMGVFPDPQSNNIEGLAHKTTQETPNYNGKYKN